MKNKIIFTMIIVLLFISNVYASSVKINGGSLDIYDSGGYGYATFDKGSNTLTLNGYNNDYILLEGFNGKTVNVILKGNNTIHSSGYIEDSNITALGFDYDSSSENVILSFEIAYLLS